MKKTFFVLFWENYYVFNYYRRNTRGSVDKRYGYKKEDYQKNYVKARQKFYGFDDRSRSRKVERQHETFSRIKQESQFDEKSGKLSKKASTCTQVGKSRKVEVIVEPLEVVKSFIDELVNVVVKKAASQEKKKGIFCAKIIF